MASFNKIILMGNLTRDPQLSYLPSQTPVVEIGLATNRRYRTQDGQMREDVCFVDCRCFGRQAETINQYLRKGRPVLIEGRLELDQWEDQNGQKRSKHRVFIERFSFVDSGGGGGQGGGGYDNRSGGGTTTANPSAGPGQPNQANQAPPMGGSQDSPPSSYDEGGEEIPF